MVEAEDFKIPAVSGTGVAFGYTVADFLAEFTARVTGQVAWYKVGVKALIKLLVGLIFYGIASRVSGLWSLGFELATYGSIGSIAPDVAWALAPGGIPGWAERAAVKVRAGMKGAKTIEEEFKRVEEEAAIAASRT